VELPKFLLSLPIGAVPAFFIIYLKVFCFKLIGYQLDFAQYNYTAVYLRIVLEILENLDSFRLRRRAVDERLLQRGRVVLQRENVVAEDDDLKNESNLDMRVFRE